MQLIISPIQRLGATVLALIDAIGSLALFSGKPCRH